jgi:hypothetical protein
MPIVLRITDEEYIERQVSSLPHCPVDGRLMHPTEMRRELQQWWEFWRCECGQQIIMKCSTAHFSVFLDFVKDFIQWAREDWLRLISITSALLAFMLSVTALILSLTAS